MSRLNNKRDIGEERICNFKVRLEKIIKNIIYRDGKMENFKENLRYVKNKMRKFSMSLRYRKR